MYVCVREEEFLLLAPCIGFAIGRRGGKGVMDGAESQFGTTSFCHVLFCDASQCDGTAQNVA